VHVVGHGSSAVRQFRRMRACRVAHGVCACGRPSGHGGAPRAFLGIRIGSQQGLFLIKVCGRQCACGVLERYAMPGVTHICNGARSGEPTCRLESGPGLRFVQNSSRIGCLGPAWLCCHEGAPSSATWLVGCKCLACKTLTCTKEHTKALTDAFITLPVLSCSIKAVRTLSWTCHGT